MGTPRFTPEFKEEAVRQIMERGDSVAEVSNRRGVPAHSLYKWLRAWGQSIFRAIRVNERCIPLPSVSLYCLSAGIAVPTSISFNAMLIPSLLVTALTNLEYHHLYQYLLVDVH